MTDNDHNNNEPATGQPPVNTPAAATPVSNESLFMQRLQRIPLFSPNMTEDDFFRCLSTFLSLFGFPLHRFPSIQGRPIAMKYLFLVVLSQGGFEKVDQARLWPHIDEKMGFPQAPSMAMSVSRTHYYGLFQQHPQSSQQQQQQQLRGPQQRVGPQTIPMSAPPPPPPAGPSGSTTTSQPNLHQSHSTITDDRPTKTKERISYWQQLSIVTKPFRIPTTLGDLGAVSLKSIFLSLSSGSRLEEARALNCLQCLVHPGRLNDKDIAISLPPNAPYLRDIIQYLLAVMKSIMSELPRLSLPKLHLQVLSHRYEMSHLDGDAGKAGKMDLLEMAENCIRGLACGEGKSSLILFDNGIRADLISIILDAVCRPVSLRSFTNNLTILSRLSTGAGTMTADQLSSFLDLVLDEVSFVGPLFMDICSQPRFAVCVDNDSNNNSNDDHIKALQGAKEKMAFLTSLLPGHLYLLLHSIVLLQCNVEQNRLDWQPHAEQMSRLILLLFKYLLQPILPTWSSMMMSMRFVLSLSKRAFLDNICQSIKDGGYVELILMITWYSMKQDATMNMIPVDAVLPSVFALLDGLFDAYCPATASPTTLEGMRRHCASMTSDHVFLDLSDSHPQPILSRCLDIVVSICASNPESVGNAMVSLGYFERFFEWLERSERLVLVVDTNHISSLSSTNSTKITPSHHLVSKALWSAIDACGSAFI